MVNYKNAFLVFLSLGFTLIMPFQAFASFKDVPPNHPQFTPIKTLELEKVIHGYSNGTFQPEKLATRAEFLKTLFADIGFHPEPKAYMTGFKDIDPQSWYAGYVKKALELNLIPSPRVNPYFSADKPISRIEALRIAFSIGGISAPYYTDINPEDLFKDIQETSPFAYLAYAAKKNGVISEKNPQYLMPYKSLSRGDMAELIYQIQLVRNNTVQGSVSLPPSEQIFNGLDEVSAKFIDNPKFPLLLDVWEKANTEFYYKNGIQQEDLIYAAIEGMTSKLNDPYTNFYTPLEAAKLTQYLEGEFEGIGIEMELSDNHLTIINIFPGSPAEKEGLKRNDIITSINGKNIESFTMDDILNMVKGNAGTTLKLAILRNSTTLQFEIVREKINLPHVNSKILPHNIGYISIGLFTTSTASDFKKNLDTLMNSSPKAFILDLRSNPGGDIESATQILGHFIQSGKILTTLQSADKVKQSFFSEGTAELKDYPVIVLVNGDTASAAEIVAGALQEYKIAKLIGEKTFGKGSAQQIYEYPDHSLLKISIAHWLTPLGKDIHGTGLTPDIQIDLTEEDLTNDRDTQLNKAIEELQR